MKTFSNPRLGLAAAAAILFIGLGDEALHAYPPAPYHTLYGMVRNEWGDPLDFSAAEVYVSTTNNVTARAVVAPTTTPGINYTLRVPMDAGTAPDLYSPEAMKGNQAFRLRVRIGQQDYLPIEMFLNPVGLGRPAQATRLDLTLGVDSDHDGLPDAWEEALIAIYGGDLSTINPNDDLDGDGISNLNEYLAGTYAFDPSDGFVLNMISAGAGKSVMEFLAVRGRTYSFETTTDLRQQWLPTLFRVGVPGQEGVLLSSYQATNTLFLRIEVQADGPVAPRRFFRAKVN